MQVLPLVLDIPSHIALCRGLSYYVTGKFAQCETCGPVMIVCGLDVSARLITRAQSIKVLNMTSGNNVFGNVIMCFSMLVFLVVSVVVPQNNGFQRFISWFVGVVLGLNLINNIRLLSGLAKKKLVKGNRLIAARKSSQYKVAACLCFFVSLLTLASQEEEVVNKYQKQYERFVSLLIYVSDLESFTLPLS